MTHLRNFSSFIKNIFEAKLSLFLHLQMDVQPEITELKVENVSEPQQQVVTAEANADGDKSENMVKENSNSAASPSVSTQEIAPPSTTIPTTVIATRQRMITTQGLIREISVGQGQDVSEQYEQYQITASGDDQNVYTYEQNSGGIITISNQPENLQATSLLKRNILLEKEQNGNGGVPVVNVVNAEPQTVYVELKNDNTDQARYLPNATIRYESADRYHRFAYHGLPPHNPAHIAHHQRELALKSENGHLTPQEIQIYEAEQGAQNHQQNNQQGEQNSIGDHQSNESKTHYTNLEPVGTSQSSYYISSESYQPTNNGFTYVPTPTTKEGPYLYHHPGSPVLYKSNYSFTLLNHSSVRYAKTNFIFSFIFR